MSNLLENMNIERIVLHQVFKRNDNKSIKEPFYNSSLTNLDRTGMFTFRQRVIQAIGNDSNSMEMDIYKNGLESTFEYVTKIINSHDDEFIEISKKIAMNLADAQTTRRIPEGIVVIFEGTIGKDNNKYVGIMKAEMQQGFELSNNKLGIDLQFIQNLILTPHQKLYKIGLFIKECSNDSENFYDYNCFVYDSNLGKGINSEAAQYFYDGFLGCKFKDNNKFLTKQFYNETKSFVDKLANVSDEEKVELNYALYTYAKLDQSPTISTKDFSDKYIKKELKEDYRIFMETNKFPSTAVSKDLTLLESSLKKRRIKFTEDISLSAPSENFNDIVKIKGKDSIYTTIDIKGHIVSQD